MIDLTQFRNNAIARGLCSGYTDKWGDEKGKRELFELACDANAVSFMAKSLSEGWGLSPEFISDKFKAYINGKYICKYRNGRGNGYTSAMLCEFKENSFEVNTTLLSVLSTKTTLNIKPYHVCHIHACKSDLVIHMGDNSRCYVTVYGDDSEISGDNMDDVLLERLFIKHYEEEKNG